jgi:hypothetical protein
MILIIMIILLKKKSNYLHLKKNERESGGIIMIRG